MSAMSSTLPAVGSTGWLGQPAELVWMVSLAVLCLRKALLSPPPKYLMAARVLVCF